MIGLLPYTSPSSFNFARQDYDSIPVPTTPTVVQEGDCWLIEMDVVNTSESAITLTVSNSQGGSPLIVDQVEASSANGNSMLSFRSQVGKLFTGGLVWSASASGLVGSVCIKVA